MDSLDKIDNESLFGMIEDDLKSCIKGKNESWEAEEYESMLRIINEIKLRFNLVKR